MFTNGLEGLSAHFHWVAGPVIYTGADPASSPSNTGVCALVLLNPIPEDVEDLQNDRSVTIDAPSSAHFPFTMTPESLACPRTTPHRSLSFTPNSQSPVLGRQATFVHGGMLLTFVVHHNVMDITSQAVAIKPFDKACKMEERTE
ncbi:hypothetical protein CVT25_011436 [Psilocybe cyanescens]|uniref:Trichothecene 3-O-acetyltransferase-like N-terminal domain-containing protein n=1 Tax=Psilocybe cyanescens TaxID=93625 RepID=A0A409W2H0_PSICY|nr:hypothetical protein CVT25_011436 [Psilocybe cyanescens]